jgi:hypothetical protein
MATLGDDVDLIIWSIIEVYTAIICASLVSIRPLIAKLIPSLFPATKATETKSKTASSSPARPLKVGSRTSARLRSGNGTVLFSDDEVTVDDIGKVFTKASVVDQDSDIELSDRGLPFGNAHLEPEFQHRPK